VRRGGQHLLGWNLEFRSEAGCDVRPCSLAERNLVCADEYGLGRPVIDDDGARVEAIADRVAFGGGGVMSIRAAPTRSGAGCGRWSLTTGALLSQTPDSASRASVLRSLRY
jgi:hypothetical protein